MDKHYLTNSMQTKFITIFTIIITYILIPTPLAAQSSLNIETLLRGNQLYESKLYLEASQTYQQLIDIGLKDHTLYYNLGNAYFKQNDLGQAILNYERAMQLAPRDTDIRANLDLARSQLLDKYDITSASPLYQVVALGSEWLTLNEMTLVVLALWILLILLVLIYRRTNSSGLRESLPLVLTLFAILWIGSIVVLGNRIYLEHARPQAVVLAPEVEVRSGPGEYTVQFDLHSGAKVSIMEQRGEWVSLALPGEQLQGWVEASNVDRIHTRTYDLQLAFFD